MAKIIDISEKLGNQKPYLKIGENEYKVNNSLPAMIAIMAKVKNMEDDIESLKDILAIACGKELPEYLLETEASMEEWRIVMETIVSIISGDEGTTTNGKKKK